MAYAPNCLKWVKITKTYSDFAIAGLTNNVSIYTLATHEMIHSVIINPTTSFQGGTIATYTISIGIPSPLNATAYLGATSVLGGTITANNPTLSLSLNNNAVSAYAISTIGNLNAATQGSVDFYLLVSTLP